MAENRFALIIASYQYNDNDLRQLTAPAQDAEALAEVLADPAIGGFEVKEPLIDRPYGEVREAINEFFNDRSPDDLMLLYFSGHGVKHTDGTLYFATINTDRKKLRTTAIESDLVHKIMLECRAKRQLLILDCCYGGAFAKGMGLKKSDESIGIEERLGGRGRIVLTASDSMQYAFEGDKIEGQASYSIFTRALIDGLKSGKADMNGDGRISVDELYDYAYQQTRENTQYQTPLKIGLMEGQLIIANTREPPKPKSQIDQFVLDLLRKESSRDRFFAMGYLIEALKADDIGLANQAREELERISKEDSEIYIRNAASAALESLYGVEFVEAETQKKRLEKEQREKVGEETVGEKEIRIKSPIQLRSDPTFLTYEDVKTIIKTNNFFHVNINKEGKGLNHIYQAHGETVIDYETGLMWQEYPSDKRIPFEHAEEVISNINNNKYGGYSDWRLPTVEETLSLMEPESKTWSLDPYIAKIFTRNVSWVARDWILTADKSRGGNLWYVNFSTGKCSVCSSGYPFYNVLATRATSIHRVEPVGKDEVIEVEKEDQKLKNKLEDLIYNAFNDKQLRDTLDSRYLATSGTKVELVKRLLAEYGLDARAILDLFYKRYLIEVCNKYGLPSSGNKSELISRILEAFETGSVVKVPKISPQKETVLPRQQRSQEDIQKVVKMLRQCFSDSQLAGFARKLVADGGWDTWLEWYKNPSKLSAYRFTARDLLSLFTTDHLKAACRINGLPVDGEKSKLIGRLLAAFSLGDISQTTKRLTEKVTMQTKRERIPKTVEEDRKSTDFIIPAGVRDNIPFDLGKGDMLEFSVTETQSEKDISIAVEKPGGKYVLSPQRIENSSFILITGTSGKYRIILDNTYSKLRKKRVHLDYSVVRYSRIETKLDKSTNTYIIPKGKEVYIPDVDMNKNDLLSISFTLPGLLPRFGFRVVDPSGNPLNIFSRINSSGATDVYEVDFNSLMSGLTNLSKVNISPTAIYLVRSKKTQKVRIFVSEGLLYSTLSTTLPTSYPVTYPTTFSPTSKKLSSFSSTNLKLPTFSSPLKGITQSYNVGVKLLHTRV